MEKLMNIENEWSNSTDASKVESAVMRIEVEEMWYAINHIKIGWLGPLGLLWNCLKLVGISAWNLWQSWCPSRVCFESTFIYHGNGCSDRRCEG